MCCDGKIRQKTNTQATFHLFGMFQTTSKDYFHSPCLRVIATSVPFTCTNLDKFSTDFLFDAISFLIQSYLLSLIFIIKYKQRWNNIIFVLWFFVSIFCSFFMMFCCWTIISSSCNSFRFIGGMKWSMSMPKSSVAKWKQNQTFLLPSVWILIVMWTMMQKSVENIADIDDDPMCQCNSRQEFWLYSTKSMFPCHKYTHSSKTGVAPTIPTSTS